MKRLRLWLMIFVKIRKFFCECCLLPEYFIIMHILEVKISCPLQSQPLAQVNNLLETDHVTACRFLAAT